MSAPVRRRLLSAAKRVPSAFPGVSRLWGSSCPPEALSLPWLSCGTIEPASSAGSGGFSCVVLPRFHSGHQRWKWARPERTPAPISHKNLGPQASSAWESLSIHPVDQNAGSVRSSSTAAATVASPAEANEDTAIPSGGQSDINQGILVELGILPPYNPEAEAEAARHEVITAYRRQASGKTSAKNERKAGRTPSVLFEQADGHKGGNKQLIALQTRQLTTLLRKYGRSRFQSRVFEMRIVEEGEELVGDGGHVERVLAKSVQEHASTDEVLNVTFLRMPKSEGARVKVEVPLQFIGEDACPGIRKGGWLFCMRRLVPFECPWENIPPYIEVDLSTMRVGQILLLEDLKVDPSCRLLVHNSKLPVCKIAGSKSLEAGME